MEDNQQKFDIGLKEEVAEGIYSNLSIISHSSNEFVLDFIRILPGVKPQVKSRIILTPENAKRLLNALEENVEKYEEKFGTIKFQTPGNNNNEISFGFSGPVSNA